jgi:hypothetical protein
MHRAYVDGCRKSSTFLIVIGKQTVNCVIEMHEDELLGNYDLIISETV